MGEKKVAPDMGGGRRGGKIGWTCMNTDGGGVWKVEVGVGAAVVVWLAAGSEPKSRPR